MIKNKHYLNSQIITYLGNKRKIIPYLEDIITQIKGSLHKDKIVAMDGFAGSGIVSRMLKEHSSLLVSNDIEPYCFTLNSCYLANKSEINISLIHNYIDALNDNSNYGTNVSYVRKHWCPADDNNIQLGERVYYTNQNGYIIDNIREMIEHQIPYQYKPFLLAPLLVKTSIHTNTGGIFNSFYKKEGKGHFGGKNENNLDRIKKPIRLDPPIFSKNECPVIIKQEDTNQLIHTINKEIGHVFDVVYYDPPYNKHPYGTYYFMLNIINQWEKEKPVPDNFRGQDNDWFRSKYNSKRYAEDALNHLIKYTQSKYIILSYNNKGIIPIKQFKEILSSYGDLTMVPVTHKTYNRLIGQSSYKKKSSKSPIKEYIWVLRVYAP